MIRKWIVAGQWFSFEGNIRNEISTCIPHRTIDSLIRTQTEFMKNGFGTSTKLENFFH